MWVQMFSMEIEYLKKMILTKNTYIENTNFKVFIVWVYSDNYS